MNNNATVENSLHNRVDGLVKHASRINTPKYMTNISINYTAPKLRTILISDLIYTYKMCESTAFKVPSWETKRNSIACFRYCLKHLGMTEDMDTRYLGGRHPKTGLPLGKHLIRTMPESFQRVKVAKSLFSKGMVEFYEERGIETSYFATWTTLVVRAKPTKQFIPDRIIENVIAKCEAEKDNRTHFYMGYLLCYGLGLRNSEMRRAKWDDLYEDLDGNKCIRIHAPKSGGEFQDRPCDPYYWDKLMEMRGFGTIVKASSKEMRELFPQFLKNECGIKERRAVHLLRKYCGHRLMRSNGIYPASKALGHADTKITDMIYSGLPTLKATA